MPSGPSSTISSATLAGGGVVTAVIGTVPDPSGYGTDDDLVVTLSGQSTPVYFRDSGPLWGFDTVQVEAMTDGGFILGLTGEGHGGGEFDLYRFDASGQLEHAGPVLSVSSIVAAVPASIAALADGAYVAAWNAMGATSSEEFLANGDIPFGGVQPLSRMLTNPTGAPTITPDPTGGYAVSWTDSGGAESLTFRQAYYDAAGQPAPVSGWPPDDQLHSYHTPATGGGTYDMASLPTIYSDPEPPAGFVANGGNNTVTATNGDESFWVGPTDTVIVPDGLTGTKTIYAWDYSETLPAGVNNLVFYGPDTAAVGNALPNLMIMGSDDRSWMDGGPGNDVLVGGGGQNNFVVEAGDGDDVIYNFHAGQDTVTLNGVALESFAQVTAAMTQQGADVVLQIDPSETLTFRGVTVGDFSAANFNLPQGASGQTFDSDDSGDVWVGTAGDDTFNLGRGGDWVTGNGGNDTYRFAAIPWAGGHITDFNAGDVLDLTGLMSTTSDSGTDGFADGYLKITDDGSGAAQVWADYHIPGNDGWWLVETLDGVSPSSLTHSGDVVSVGASSGGGGTAGQTFNSDNNGDVWVGTAGDDTFNLGRGGDWVSGNGGNDTYRFAAIPWAGGHVTDFNAGDVLDLTGLMSTTSDTGSDGFADGYLKITDDGQGDAQVWADYHVPGNDGWWLVETLDGVAPASLQHSGDAITVGASSGGGGGPTDVSTSDPSYTATASVKTITLTGSRQHIDASATAGVTITSNDTGNVLIGGAGDDIFHIGRGGDWIAGGAGADTFAYAGTPWARGGITDFNAAEGDKVDVGGLLQASGYTGADPFADGYLQLTSDASGDAQLWSDVHQPGNDGWWLVATLDGVSTSSLHYAGGLIT